MSEMDEAAAAASVPALPEDVVAEILARVTDVVTLFRCAAACRPWRRLVADPAFLRCFRWPEDSLLGFFVQRHQLSVNARRKVTRLFPTLAPVFVPAPGSALGPGRRFLASFVRDDAGLLDQAKPLAAREGLLLGRLSRRSSDNSTVLRLCVRNLLTGRSDRLPALDVAIVGADGVRGYAVLTATDHGAGPHRPAGGYATFFQVLLTGMDIDRRDYVVKFSSSAAATPRGWSCFPGHLSLLDGCRLAAVSRGTAHWLFHRDCAPNEPSLYTMAVNASTGRVSAAKLPLDDLPHIIRWDRSRVWLCLSMDARLSLLCLKDNQLLIWSQQGGDQGGAEAWRLTQAVQVGVEQGLFGMESLSAVCIGERSGTMLALYHSDPDRAYVLDLESGSTTMLAGWKRSFNYMTAVPYEINCWPEFFMSRLGVQT